MFLVSWPGGSWEATAKYAAAILVLYLSAIWLTLVFWTYRDVRQRTRDPILQTVGVLLVLVFFLPGHWIYLIVRPRYTLAEMYERSLEEEALLQELEDQKACPTCKRRVLDDYLICPSCRTQLKETCRSCAKPLTYAWVACPFCGLEKPPREGVGARGARPPQRGAAPLVGHPPAEQAQRSQLAAHQTVQRSGSRPAGTPPRDPFGGSQSPGGDGPPVIGE